MNLCPWGTQQSVLISMSCQTTHPREKWPLREARALVPGTQLAVNVWSTSDMTPDDFRNSLGKWPWGQRTHFTAKFIITTQLGLLGCMSHWQAGTSACKRVWVCPKWWSTWAFVVARLGVRSGVPLHCGSAAREWPKGRNNWEGEKSFMSGTWINANSINNGWDTFLLLALPLWGNYTLPAKCLSWAGMEPTSEHVVGQSKFISTGEKAASPFVWAVSLFITESSSATSILRFLLSQQPVAPLQASLRKQLEPLVPSKFLQVMVFLRAEHCNLAFPCLSCAPVPTILGTSAFLSMLVMKTDV